MYQVSVLRDVRREVSEVSETPSTRKADLHAHGRKLLLSTGTYESMCVDLHSLVILLASYRYVYLTQATPIFFFMCNINKTRSGLGKRPAYIATYSAVGDARAMLVACTANICCGNPL